jgi:hypothetical protein
MTDSFPPALLQAIEQLDYRATVGEVAAQAGWELNRTQQSLLTLAADAGGHLQVAQSGEMVFLFPPNFRILLSQKYWRLRWRAFWGRVWRVVFYLIRLSFGVVLILSILLMLAAIIAILVALNSKEGDSGGSDDRGWNFFFLPTDIFWIFDPSVVYNRQEAKSQGRRRELNFLEAVFSFLFGDGDPNYRLEEKRWQLIGAVLRNRGGAVAGEQILPYLEAVSPQSLETEDYILPVLARFNGYPQVSEQGEMVYTFPDLQSAAQERQRSLLPTSLQETPRRFSAASPGQIIGAVFLGGVNLILALILGHLLTYDTGLEIINWIAWLYPFLAYGVGFLAIPLGRYLVLQRLNKNIQSRNQGRRALAERLLHPSETLRHKLDFARSLEQTETITPESLVYSTESSVLEQLEGEKDWE